MKNFKAQRPFRDKSSSRDAGSFKSGRFNRGDDTMQLYPATCAQCGDACEVPFKPNNKKPVFCRACFKKEDQGDYRKPDRQQPVASSSRELEQINRKLDTILEILNNS